MIQITVSDEQARLIAEGPLPIVLVDSQGRSLGEVVPVDRDASAQAAISEEEWAEVKRRMATPGPGFTTKEVLDYLQSLDRR